MSTENETNHLSLSDIIMPYVYIRSILIYDYHIEDFEELLNEYLRLYCPQAFHGIVYDKDGNGLIVEQNRKVFSRESKLDESTSIETLFPYGVIPNDISPLIFFQQKQLSNVIQKNIYLKNYKFMKKFL